MSPTVVLAHAGGGPAGEAVVTASLAFAGMAYAFGWARWSAARPGRRLDSRPAWSFAAGLGLVWAATCTPFDAWADAHLSVHMVQHILLGLVAPLLVLLGRPLTVWSWVLDAPRRRQVERAGRSFGRRLRLRRAAPAVGLAATGAHVVSWWAWHVPVAFDAALRHEVLHGLEHVTLFATGLALWWVCVGVRWANRSAFAIICLFLAAVGTGILAALITLAPAARYDVAVAGGGWAPASLADQQLAGAIMWVPGGAVYLVAAAVLFVRWLAAGPARHLDPTPGSPSPVL